MNKLIWGPPGPQNSFLGPQGPQKCKNSKKCIFLYRMIDDDDDDDGDDDDGWMAKMFVSRFFVIFEGFGWF